MKEAEMLKLIDTGCAKMLDNQRYKILVGSSEALDAIFEECNVSLHHRVPLIKILNQF